jgi:hypothetical protein
MAEMPEKSLTYLNKLSLPRYYAWKGNLAA